MLASLVRVSAAAALVWVCWQDLPAIESRYEFEALPTFDYWKEASNLLDQQRFSEAEMVTDAGLAQGPPDQQKALQELKQTIGKEQGRWYFQLSQAGRGAIMGNGESAAALGGAVVADLFVFGDIRDLVIQAGHKLKGEQADPIIVGLATLGIATTADPPADLGVALLKFARRMGGLTKQFAASLLDALKRATKSRDTTEVRGIADNIAALSKRSDPAPALAILKHVDDPAELAVARQLAEKENGIFTLWLGGDEALRWLKVSTGNEGLMLKAARRGRQGFAYLAKNGELMFRAHPLLGLIKGLYKGTLPALLLDFGWRWSEAILGFAMGWLAYEVLLLLGRSVLAAGSGGPKAIPPEPSL